MTLLDLRAPTAEAIRTGIADGSRQADTVAEASIARIEQCDESLGAFVDFNTSAVRTAVAALPGPRKADRLYGVPVGVKDIIDTALLPTSYGSPIYAGHQPAADAYVVSRIRSLGAVIMGKTATAEFAWTHPPATANPWNPAHTPGGSSSGSAAAVAAGMVPIALGTQTSGSVIRPALYCGVIGIKPTFGTINRTGVKPAADSLDTLGLFAREVADGSFFLDAVCGRNTELPESGTGMTVGVLIPESTGVAPSMADDCALTALERAAETLEADGCTVRRMTVPAWYEEIFGLQETIAAYEGARALAFERIAFGDMLSETLRRFLDEGARISMKEYLAAIRRVDLLRPLADAWLSEVDAIATIGVNGEAPADRTTTGDPHFCRPWSALHTPSVAVPTAFGPAGMPIGVQIVAARWCDARALCVAHRLDLGTRAERIDASVTR